MIIIGERVNATRTAVRKAIGSRDADAICQEISRQEKHGAHYIDLNAGTGEGDTTREQDDIRWLIDVALEATEKKFSLDSADPEVLRAAAEHLGGRRDWMLNSVKNDAHILEPGLALAAEHGVPLIALVMDGESIPTESGKRIEIAQDLAAKAEAKGVGQEKLFFDPLVFPISADITQGMVTLETLHGIKAALPKAKTVMGLTNFSHGLTKRAEINRAFLSVSITHGLDAAICDPSRKSVRKGLILGQLIAGKDRHCRRFSRSVRQGLFTTEPKKDGAAKQPQGATA